MKRIRAKLRLLSESGGHPSQPLHARILRRDADKLLLGGPSDDGTLALAAPENARLTSPGLFVNYVIVDSDDAAADSSAAADSVEVLVTRELLRRCALTDGQAMVVVRGVRCPRLTKVSLLARSAEVYTTLNGPQLWETLSAGSGERGVLCRMDDSLAGFDGDSVLVVDCEPTRQGLIVPDTQVVVIRSSQESSPVAESTVSREDLAKLAGTIWYTNRILQSTQRLRPDQRAGPSRAAASSGLLRVHVLPQLPEGDFPADMDPLNCVFLRAVTMAALGLTHGSWVQAWLEEGRDSSSERRLTRQVLVCGLELLLTHFLDLAAGSGGPEEGVACMSPHLWFHLHKQDGPTLLVRPTARLRLASPSSSQQPPPAPPDVASEFHLALVRSPAYSASIDCMPLLAAHFARPRYICKGDIVTVNIHSASCPEKYLPDGSSHRHHVVFLKVTQLKGPGDAAGYLCDSRNTRLYQTGSKGCYVPMAMAAYHLCGPPHPIWDNPQPPHLALTVERLQSLLLPFLRSGPLRQRSAPCVLLSGPHGSGKRTTVAALARSLGLHHYWVDCHDLVGDTAAVTEARIKNSVLKAQQYTPCLVQLSSVEVFSQDSGGDSRAVRCLGDTLRLLNRELEEPPAVVVATTSAESDTLHPDLAHLFLHSLAIPYPDEEARAQLLDALLCGVPKSNAVNISYLAQRTAGSSLGDLCALVGQATMGAYARFRRIIRGQPAEAREAVEAGLHLAGGTLLVQGDLVAALEWLQCSQAQAVGAPRIPAVHWDDVGGLGEVKRALTDTLQLPLRHPQLLEAGLKRSGVLLYGPPGTGKTLLAKAVATECALSFLSVKGPELINMYVGQSEENVRGVFARARSAAPCVIFFDELDSLAPNRGRSGDSGGVMDRVVSQLLAEMDGLNKSADVFVIGATNRPDLLDPAILRPGRFDQLIYVGIPSDKDSQLKILRALTRKFTLAEGKDLLSRVVEQCPPNLTGADFYSLCSAAMVRAMQRHIDQLERGLVPIGSPNVPVTLEDFQAALVDLVPSVSAAELARYEDIRNKMSAPTSAAVTA